jgi:hypothetical protein
MEIPLTPRLVAQVSLLGMGLDLLGGCYLAYDLLGGKKGPLRTIARAAGYAALFFVGYEVVLGSRFATVAAAGMGIVLAFEYRGMAAGTGRESRGSVLLYGFLRGIVLGLAGMTIGGPMFGTAFGVLAGLGLCGCYLAGFAPGTDYHVQSKPQISRHKIAASVLRALAVGASGVLAGLYVSPEARSIALGLRLGLAAGAVSALVSIYSPAIEWRVECLPERRLGIVGLGLIFAGMLLQSVQYWIAALGISMR